MNFQMGKCSLQVEVCLKWPCKFNKKQILILDKFNTNYSATSTSSIFFILRSDYFENILLTLICRISAAFSGVKIPGENHGASIYVVRN